MRRVLGSLLVAALSLAALPPGAPAPPSGAPPEPASGTTTPSDSGAASDTALIVYLVRHAEKVDDSRDPALSAAGELRAARLAELLSEVGIERIHSTDLRRTRDTAAPLARALGLSVELYDPSSLPEVASRLRAEGGIHLVVGHSNTTPDLVAALGGDPVSPIDDAEYDRLYVVRVAEDGSVDSELRRFGAPFGGAEVPATAVRVPATV